MSNKKSILVFQIASAIFAMVLGTLLHFTYEWSGGNLLVASFSAVNESTWEHLKILFFPMLITTIIGCFYFSSNVSNFLCAKTIGIITALLFTTSFFYTYTGILGSNIAVLNIISFFIAIIIGEYVAYKIMRSYFSCNKKFAIISLIVLTLCFILFTYITPQIGLFKDPVSGGYGITKS